MLISSVIIEYEQERLTSVTTGVGLSDLPPDSQLPRPLPYTSTTFSFYAASLSLQRSSGIYFNGIRAVDEAYPFHFSVTTFGIPYQVSK